MIVVPFPPKKGHGLDPVLSHMQAYRQVRIAEGFPGQPDITRAVFHK